MLSKIYYWAGWSGERNMVFLFLKGLGISPFAKAYRGCSVVTACIIGEQIELLKMLTTSSTYYMPGSTVRNK